MVLDKNELQVVFELDRFHLLHLDRVKRRKNAFKLSSIVHPRKSFESQVFSEGIFHGGTYLRIMFGMNRFSEDLDFFLFHLDALAQYLK